MKKVISWIITPIYLILFYLILLVFHPIQMICRRISYQAHKRSVDMMSWWLVHSLRILGTRIELNYPSKPLPTDRPLIVMSNHQSMYDIPLMAAMLKDNHPKYVAKKELATGTPSVSYNIRHGGSVAIDRADPRQAIRAIDAFGKYIEKNNYAACIFPEGSRARDGMMKPFKIGGVAKLYATVPSGLIVPVAIDGSWELLRYKLLPIPIGVKVSCTILEPIEREGYTGEEVLYKVEQAIRQHLKQPERPATPLSA